MEWYLKVIKNYTGFTGRARRKEFWMFYLINILISLAIAVVEGIVGSPGFIGMLYSLAVLIPTIAVSIRRLHDTCRSGWWLLITLIPLIGAIVLIVFCAQDSKDEDNEYGDNPKLAGAE